MSNNEQFYLCEVLGPPCCDADEAKEGGGYGPPNMPGHVSMTSAQSNQSQRTRGVGRRREGELRGTSALRVRMTVGCIVRMLRVRLGHAAHITEACRVRVNHEGEQSAPLLLS